LIGAGCLLAFGSIWTLIATAVFLMTRWSGAPWYFTLFTSMFVLVGLGMVGASIWALIVKPALVGRHFGPPLASVQPNVAEVGSSIQVRFERPVRANVEVRRFAMQLVLRESATYRRGTNNYTVTHDAVIDAYEVPARTYVAGETLAEERTFQIPRDGMHSLDAPHNKLAWFARILIDTPNAPDVADDMAFVVAPAVAGEAHRDR
jgi:hypothetical protein